MPTSRQAQVKAPGFSGNPKLWAVSRSSGDQLSTSRPQPTSDSVPVATIGPLKSLATLGQDRSHRSHSGTASPPAGPPLIILVSKTSFLLALARRHNLPLIFTFPLQPGSTTSQSQPLIATLTGQVTGRSPTQPQDCGQPPVFRRPAKHLQTTADFRLGRQVTLAQPSASSQGYRLRRANQSSSPGQGPRHHQVAASRSSLHRTGHRLCADATLKLW